jgi:mono/diheme cytochrome c family protein
MALGCKLTVRLATLASLGVLVCAITTPAAEPTPIDFTRDVRPILSENCFHCHGPDAAERQADLRLDIWQNAGDILGAEHVITPGKPDDSEFIARITSDDEAMRMPPADSGKSLTPEQIEILRRWIAGGAEYKQHWAFVAPRRPNIPAVRDPSWIRNPIDAFILARLEQEGLKPSPPAAPNALLRRLSLDLIGLPPTVEELAEFEKAGGEKSYAKQILRLLESPHFGERWGRLWLDVARYSDSDGFEKDKPRFVWMYRDWVIDALNRDMPYDEFIVEQIAGDLLPEPAQDNLVATGFLRNSMINEEGGIDPEQFRMEAMFDRMDAIGKAVLGVTVQCAQCHTHKYDPLTHTDYYRMFAFLNNCHEGQISVYTTEQQRQWKATYALIRRIEDRLRANSPDWPERMATWEESAQGEQAKWTVIRPKALDESGQKYYSQDDGSILAAGYAPTLPVADFEVDIRQPKITAVRLEVLNDPNLPHGGPGRSIDGTFALTEFTVQSAPLDAPGKRTDLKFVSATADVNPPERELEKIFDDRGGKRRVTGPIEYANDDDALTAWTVEIGPHRSNVPRKAVFMLDKPLDATDGVRLTLRLAQQHGGWNSDENQNNNLGRFRFSITADEKPVADPLPADVRALLKVPAAERTPEQTDRLFSYWRTNVPEWHEENRQIDALWHSHPRGATQLVLLERDQPRATHRLERGNFLAPAEEVSPGVPEFLHPLPRGAFSPKLPDSRLGETRPRATRLDFAHWLADRRSPTTARAIVNRIWQAYFGIGLVATAEDLGTQGEHPSHPELLDWLAVELMDNNWSLKHIHRLIVNSATYRQSSNVTPELLARDPANRLLARGARFRVDAEAVRDIALAASGLLYNKIGGPSVHPPAPEFLFQPPISYGPKTWIVETGPNRYRRALYTFRYRALPYPMLQTFDAPNGEVACARRVRSNTPLQALTTLNEPLFVESARALALKILSEGGSDETDRLTYAIRRCLSREPKQGELTVLREFLSKQADRFSKRGNDAWLLLIDHKEQKDQLEDKLPVGSDPAELAAWTALARVVLNLDETITKE